MPDLAPLFRRGRTAKQRKLSNAQQRRSNPGSNYKFYNSTAWKKTRKQYRTANPLCVECEQQGRVTVGTQVDHKTPINSGGDRYNWDNLQTLCASHHSAKTRREMGEGGSKV